ncbi:hypothetical protein [Spirulina subsalsa]|nr:hypothetical protein [Spirulina subsalsa]
MSLSLAKCDWVVGNEAIAFCEMQSPFPTSREFEVRSLFPTPGNLITPNP